MTDNNWFAVDRDGLAQVLADRGRAQLLIELIANAWDEEGTRNVEVNLTAVARSPFITVSITDDSPEGFDDLTHAFTLFAPSKKKGNAEVRGRFNLGEKLVLAVCDWAIITSTKGTVEFRDDGRTNRKTKRDVGTEFAARIRMTRDELRETEVLLRRLLPPSNVETRVRIEYAPGEVKSFNLVATEPSATAKETLATVIADDEGFLKRAQRKTDVLIYALRDEDEEREGWVFEMGIPVVEIGGPFDVNVMQKVPLNTDRDNVPPAFRRKLRTVVLDCTSEALTEEQAREEWVTDALPLASDNAVGDVMDHRFGKKRVSYDPSDPEANALAASKGYTVVPGGSLSGDAWGRARDAGAIKPAGQVTPSPKQEFSSTGEDVMMPESEWPEGTAFLFDRFREIAFYLLGVEIDVRLASRLDAGTAACYGECTLIFSLRKLGKAWFGRGKGGRLHADHLDLLVHELGHEQSGNHYDERYHNALTFMAGRLALWAAVHPGWIVEDSAAKETP